MNTTAVHLPQDTWAEIVRNLRYASHNTPDDGHCGMGDKEQKAAHRQADAIATQLAIAEDCEDCEAEHYEDLKGCSGHTEPEETCKGCEGEPGYADPNATSATEWPAGQPDPGQGKVDAIADAAIQQEAS